MVIMAQYKYCANGWTMGGQFPIRNVKSCFLNPPWLVRVTSITYIHEYTHTPVQTAVSFVDYDNALIYEKPLETVVSVPVTANFMSQT